MKKRKCSDLIIYAMKFTIGQLFLAFIFISTLYAKDGAAQGILEKTISVNAKNVDIATVLTQIKSQVDVKFVYSSKVIKANRTITANFVDKKLGDFINEYFKPLGIGYSVVDNKVLLFSFTMPSSTIDDVANVDAAETLVIAEKIISGTVLDDKGIPLAGATVTLKSNTQIATTTNKSGNFSIQVSGESAVLLISYVGFKPLEITVNAGEPVTVKLEIAEKEVEEVIVVGYGSQRKKDVTGAVSSVKAQDLNLVNAVSIDNLLQGKAAGVVIAQRSAQPGGGLSITVRGALSPRGSNEPLYVIDGVPLTTVGASNSGKTGPGGGNNIEGVDRSPLASINPNDIVSIEILKDASAAAIYGSAAAGGVVLITTKRGTTGKPTVSLSSSYARQKLAAEVKPLGAQEFMNLANSAERERFLFDGRFAPYGVAPAPLSGWAINYSPAEIEAATTSYNHYDAIFRPGMIADNNISISGGNEKTKFFSSINYLDQKSLLKTTDFTRFSGRINLDQTFNSWFKLSLNTLFSQSDATNPSIGGGRSNTNEARQTQAAMFFSPRLALELPDGSLTINDLPKTPNPAAWLYMKDQSVNKRIFIAPNLQFKINSAFNANVVIGYDNTNSGRENFSPTKARLPEQTQNNYGGFSNNENSNLSAEAFITYNKQFSADHRLSVVAGGGYYRASGTQYGLSVFNIPTDAVENYNLSLAPQSDLNSFYSGKFSRTKMSQFGRLNYVFKEKYFLGITARNDGSSAFPPQSKWGLFPAISAAWNISDENFMTNAKNITNLKIRASYGATGNESFLANNIFYIDQYAASFGTNYYIGGQQSTGVVQTQLANNNLRWETNITANIGVDFGFFKGRLTGSIDVFQRTAKDLLDFGQLPFNSSITSIAQNVGSTQSKGFDLALNGTIIDNKDFSWNLNVNISRSRVNWLERNPNVALNPWVGAKDGVFEIYGWEANGFFKSREEVQNYKAKNGTILQPFSFAGNPKYIDQNEDGKLDQLDVKKLGNFDPNFNFGFGTAFRYKAFGINLQTYGFLGRSMFDGWQAFSSLLSVSQRTNQHETVREVWSSSNPTGFRPGIGGGPTEANNPAGFSNYFLTEVDFLRIKNLSFSYTLPVSFLQAKRIAKNASLFVDFQNLAVFTNYNGLDAEMELNASPFPIPRTTSVGLNITF